jgi:hypothetical protein
MAFINNVPEEVTKKDIEGADIKISDMVISVIEEKVIDTSIDELSLDSDAENSIFYADFVEDHIGLKDELIDPEMNLEDLEMDWEFLEGDLEDEINSGFSER